jgi:uroporphyrinogen decarboxylase
MKEIINIILNKKPQKIPPIWIMRQAGRYLPEYLKIRSKAKNFLDFCYNPKLASEATLQPINRFNFDAAIIFSDILVIPDALGVKVDFIKDKGPILGDFEIKKLNQKNISKKLNPVFEAIEITKSKLSKNKTLIGFSGSPWTLACYMIEKESSKNFEKIKKAAIKDKDFIDLIEILTNSVIEYLSLQIEAGVDVIKLFDSWAGIVPANKFEEFIINPNKKIVSALRKKYPKVPIICFPKGSGQNYYQFSQKVKPDVLAIDQNVDIFWAKERLQNELNQTIQGNLDNFLLAFGSKFEIEKEVKKIIENFSKKPFIFNLGHGILPQTPIENVEFLLKIIRKEK